MVRRWFTFALLALLAVGLLPRVARADQSTAHTVSVAVLALDSDDAEDQADALTGALRSRIRTSQGWSLVETSQSLGMLTAALRCPTKPLAAECEQRIADQIKSERYVFGYVMKGPQSGQVTAEVHLYQKSKPDTVVRESYADNLKDQNDDTLRTIAQRLLDRLGETAVGTLVVRLGNENGEVVIDGDKRVPLQRGGARLQLAPGSHSVEVVVAGASQKRNVLVAAGKESVLDLTLTIPPGVEPAAKPSSFPTRKLVGGSLAAGGAALFVVSTINLLAYLDDQKKAQAHEDGPDLPLDGKSHNADPSTLCDTPDERSNHMTICKLNDDRIRHSTIFWSTLAGGVVLAGIGTYLLVTDGGSSKDETKTAKKPRIVPTFGRSSGGLMITGSF